MSCSDWFAADLGAGSKMGQEPMNLVGVLYDVSPSNVFESKGDLACFALYAFCCRRL